MSLSESGLLRAQAPRGIWDRGTHADRSTGLGWAIVAIAMSIVSAALVSGRFVIGDRDLVQGILCLSALGLCGVLLQVRGWTGLGLFADVVSRFLLSSLLAALVSVVLASTDLPLQDDALEAIDRHLFCIDWQLFIGMAESCPKTLLLLSYAYTTIGWQPLTLIVLLAVCGRSAAANLFCVAWGLALAISVAVFPLVPAVGGYLHHHILRSQTHVLVSAAWRHLTILAPVREGTLRSLNADTLEGIITFPSFHAAAAVMLAWGFWHLRYARWPALILNLGMLASTPVVGGHYIVDVVFGVLVAVVALCVVTKLQNGGRSDGRYPMAACGDI